VFSLLFLEFMLFSLFPDYFCFRLARYVWAACPDQYTQFRPATVRRSCECFLWVFFIWSLTFRDLRVIHVFFPAHFLFGLAWLLPFRVAQTQCSLRRLCCSTGSLLEFCRPFLFATSCSAFTGSARGTCSRNFCRSFLHFSSSFWFGICSLCWL